jgi:hypothetical protein
MTDKRQEKVVPLTEGYQPKVPDTVERGYRPQASAPLDPKVLQPPRGGTAIQAPKTPRGKQA